MARLVIFDAAVRGVDLTGNAVVLGRSRQVDVPIHDEILSRRHCALEPTASGWRVVDLKSANGTFVNGKRVTSAPLRAHDVIEIGTSVIVLVDGSGSRERPSSRSLRNPRKAQEVVAAIEAEAGPGQRGRAAKTVRGEDPGGEARTVRRSGRRGDRPPGKRGTDRKQLRALEAVFSQWASRGLIETTAGRELVESYLLHHLVSLAARHSPPLRAVIARALERLVGSEAFAGDLDRLRAAIRVAVEQAFEESRPGERDRDSGP